MTYFYYFCICTQCFKIISVYICNCFLSNDFSRGSSKPRFLDQSIVETFTIQGTEDDPQGSCPRCNGKVFEAEKMISMRNVYHKRCFTCKECERPMDQFIACDAPDGENEKSMMILFYIFEAHILKLFGYYYYYF